MAILKGNKQNTKASVKQPIGRVVKYWGMYIGIVKDNKDVQRTGRLQVWIPEFGSLPEDEHGWKTVAYCSPFAGATPSAELSQDFANFDSTQTSYGWWAVPPDLDNHVAVLFVNGDPARGIWIGCMYEHFLNQMVPGIASSTNTYGKSGVSVGKNVPVAEYNKRMQGKVSLDGVTRPVNNPVTEAIAAQGLITDKIRGTNTSSARREAPSQVYGLLTPGPKNPKSKGNRLGGSQFVLDDGEGTEYIGLKTRSGSYIRLDETNGLIYIINKKGTAWLQLDQDGNVDIFSAKSISMRAMQDVNLRADRDVNFEAGRNINIKATKQSGGGNISLEANGGLNITSVADTKLYSKSNFDVTVDKDNKITVKGGQDIMVSGDKKDTVSGNYDLMVIGSAKQTAMTDLNIFSTAIHMQGVEAITQNGGASMILSASALSINGPPAPPALPATTASTASIPAAIPTNKKTDVLPTFTDLFVRNTTFVESILDRFMTYEPCPEHVNKGK